MIRVVLGVPSGGSPASPFVEALPAGLAAPEFDVHLGRSVVFGNFIPAQREIVMRDAIDGDYAYLFFVDDDIVLPPNALGMLLATMAADETIAVAGGLYYSRDGARPIVVDGWTSTDTSAAHIPGFTGETVRDVGGVGFGCALLRVSHAAALDPPYFPAHVYIQRRSHTARQCDEDYRYCERVRDAGHRVVLDPRVRCAHYDRAAAMALPHQWETDDATRENRMIVAEENRTRLVPFDPSQPRVVERHENADLVYIFVDE